MEKVYDLVIVRNKDERLDMLEKKIRQFIPPLLMNRTEHNIEIPMGMRPTLLMHKLEENIDNRVYIKRDTSYDE